VFVEWPRRSWPTKPPAREMMQDLTFDHVGVNCCASCNRRHMYCHLISLSNCVSIFIVRTWALEVFESWGSKQRLGPWRARGARAYNGGLGPEPPAGSRGRVPGWGSGGEAPPPEAESFLVLERLTERQNLSRCQLLAKCSIGTWYRFTPKI